ncbi:MAG: glutathione S-transferase family protein, partial [Gluconacetobacter diazotrophicus]|nr:glutathione S-transferase family protein [Gluconacetobacter diazotrophicus]
MGRLVDGVWEVDRGFPTGKDGAFERTTTRFRDRITPDGSSGFAPEAGRYRLYVSLACPWAHRCLIVRALKGL